MLQLTEVRELCQWEQERDAFNKQIEDLWDEVRKTDERKAQEYENDKRAEAQKVIDERRAKGLDEIFTFYAKQHALLGKKPTFEEIEHNNKTVNMGEFMKFCKDFDINLSKQKCSEVFKRMATNSIEMNR